MAQRKKLPRLDDPTREVYRDLAIAFDHFNRLLFFDALPPVLITLQRDKKYGGYYAHDRFADRERIEDRVAEIALNPILFRKYSVKFIFSILVHEMVHLEQAVFGKPGKKGYHNAEWARMMHDVGLKPFNTKKPELETGANCSHEIKPDAAFDLAYELLLEAGFCFRFIDIWPEPPQPKPATKTYKYTCQGCDQIVRGKFGLNIECGDCGVQFEIMGN